MAFVFEYAELNEVVRQSDKTFAKVLNNIRLSIVDGNTDKLSNAKVIDQSDQNYPDTLHMYAENVPTVLINQTVLNNLPSEVYSTESNGKIPDDCRFFFP